MLSEQIEEIASLLRKNANCHNGQLQLTSKTTDIFLSNLQFLSEDLKRYESSELGIDIQSPAIPAIIRELVSATAKLEASRNGVPEESHEDLDVPSVDAVRDDQGTT
ncbi:hypothetical protein UF64_08230 [Thalassospira sp. HJ]|nr:hypothetical protein UF64_08230 [Thalassospira sp. HJ]